MDVKYLIKVLFIVSAFFFVLVSSASFTSTFQVNKVYDTPYGEVLSTVDTRSKLECVRKCSETEICRSATFDSISKSCKTNRWFADVSNICKTGSGCFDPNALIYGEKQFETTIDQECRRDLDCVDSFSECVGTKCQCQPDYLFDGAKLECVWLTTMRLGCESDVNCVDPSSVCVLSKCQCEPGYSYDGTNNACVSSCTSYGTTFQVDIGKRLASLNERIVDDITLEDCRSLCINEASYVCKTFEYNRAISRCRLQKYTALDMPNAYKEHQDMDLYTRDCDY